MKNTFLIFSILVTTKVYSQEVFGCLTNYHNIKNGLWYEQFSSQIEANILFDKKNFRYFENPSCKNTLKNPELFYTIASYWKDSTKIKFEQNFYFENDTIHIQSKEDSSYIENSYFSYNPKTKKAKILFQIVYIFDKKSTDEKPLLEYLVFRKRKQIENRDSQLKKIKLVKDDREIQIIDEIPSAK